MSFRSKSKRRLLLLIGLLVILAGGTLWLLRGPSTRSSAHTAELRRSGIADYERGDYIAAMPKLSQYLSAIKINEKEPSEDELEALFAFADCRRRIPMPRMQHVREADQLLEKYLAYRPNDASAQLIHLRLLNKTPQFSEARALADRILQRDPKQVEALFIRAYSTYKIPKTSQDDVENAIGDLLKVDPGHVNGLLLSQQIQLQRGASPKQLIERIEPLAQTKDDPRYKLVAAETYQMLSISDAARTDPVARADWEKRGRDWLMKVAAMPPIDAEFATMVASSLDRAMLASQTIQYLRSAVDGLKPDEEFYARLSKSLVRRLWQNNVYPAVIERTKDLDPAKNQTDADLLAYRASALGALAASPAAGDDRTRLLNESEEITRALRNRVASPEALAWAILLKLDTSEPRPTQAELVRQCIEARYQNPENPVVAVRLGDAYALQGETETAVQMWISAARLAPDWGYPFARIATVRMEEGRYDEAERLANQARLMSPANRQFIALLAQARFARLPRNPNPTVLAAQLADIEKVQSAIPFESGTLPLQVTLTARTKGAPAARDRIKEALAAKPPLPLDTLLRLQSVNDAESLGMENELMAALATHGELASLPLAAQTARRLLADGKPADGLRSLLDARKKAGRDGDYRWQLAIASYRDDAGDAAAIADWTDLLQKTTGDLYFQAQFLKSPSRFRSRELWNSTIDRVKTLTGEEGSLWKLERARWILAGPELPTNLNEAIALLTELSQRNRESAEARRLLGLALARDRKYSRAAEELAGALQMSPTRVEIGLELVDALRMGGNIAEARTRLREVAAIQQISETHQMRIASLFTELGQQDAAIRMLETAPAKGERDARLGSLLRSVGRVDDAAIAYKRVLNDIEARPEDVFAGADFFASTGDSQQAQYFLDRLRTMPQSQATTEMLLGQFKERYGQSDEALSHLQRATQIEPKNPIAWKALAGFMLRSRKYDQAIAAADAGLKEVPGDLELTALKPVIATVRKLTDVEPYRVLIDTVTRQPTHTPAVATLGVLAEADAAMFAAPPSGKVAAGTQVLAKLVPLAEQYRDFWALQELTIYYHLRQNRPAKAAELAERATATLSSIPDAPRLACEAYARMGKWDKVMELVAVWRQRSAGDPLAADLMMAEAMLAKRQPLLAGRTLEPHVAARPLPAKVTADTIFDPRQLTLYGTFCRALIEQNRIAEAADRLSPLLAIEDGRSIWIALTDSLPSDTEARQWVGKAAAAMPKDRSVVDQMTLAHGYLSAARSSGAKDLLSLARSSVEPLATAAKPAPDALALAATIALAQADFPASERYWRALRQIADTPDATNNLAYTLVMSGRQDAVAEAVSLATQAVQADPENNNFRSTLARAFARAGDRGKAIEAYRKVLASDSRNVEAMVGLAEVLAAMSPTEQAEARKLLSDAAAIASQNPRLIDADLRRQLQTVGGALGATAP